MKIANIFPINNQEFYQGERIAMVLAPLVAKNLYKPEYLENSYVIMDNGLYEGNMVSNSLSDLIQMADNAPFKIDEIVIPDAMGDLEKTLELLDDSQETILRNRRYNYMVVAQVDTVWQLDNFVQFINKYCKNLPLAIAVPKRVPFDRASSDCLKIYKHSAMPIHFLGLQKSLDELLPVWNVVRSCDTSQAACLAALGIEENIWGYRRTGNPVNIEYDTVDNLRLKNVLKEIK